MSNKANHTKAQFGNVPEFQRKQVQNLSCSKAYYKYQNYETVNYGAKKVIFLFYS